MSLQLLNGECVKKMGEMDSESIDSIICDPPYGLKFMAKNWDDMGDGSSQRKWHEAWLKEAFRVLKSGGIIKAFSGTRTFHHLLQAMESAGFTEIKLEAWTYGSGFPKSHSLSKAIDKSMGTEREVIGKRKQRNNAQYSGNLVYTNNIHQEGGRRGKYKQEGEEFDITAATTEEAKQWSSWGTALKPSWEPICVGRKP